MQLPSKPRPIIREYPDALILYGKPKVGKTGIAAELTLNHVDEDGDSRALILDFERGSHTRSATALDISSYKDFTDLIASIDAAGQARSKNPKYNKDMRTIYPYDFLIVDTLDRLEEIAQVQCLAEYKASSRSGNSPNIPALTDVYELAHGLGYGLVRAKMKDMINSLRSRCLSLILISHTDDKNLTENNVMITTTDISLTGKLKNIIPAAVDCIGTVYRHANQQLWVSFKHTNTATLGSRQEYLSGTNKEFDWKDIYPMLINKSIKEKKKTA